MLLSLINIRIFHLNTKQLYLVRLTKEAVFVSSPPPFYLSPFTFGLPYIVMVVKIEMVSNVEGTYNRSTIPVNCEIVPWDSNTLYYRAIVWIKHIFKITLFYMHCIIWYLQLKRIISKYHALTCMNILISKLLLASKNKICSCSS